MGSRTDSQGPLSRGIRGGGFVGSGGVAAVFRTSRGEESFDFESAAAHSYSRVVNDSLQGFKIRAPVHKNRTSRTMKPRQKQAAPEDFVAHDGDWRLLCEHGDGSHEVLKVQGDEPVFAKIRKAGGVSQKHRFELLDMLAQNGHAVSSVTVVGWKHAADGISRSERQQISYEKTVARLKGGNKPMQWLGVQRHGLNLERMKLALTNVSLRPGLGG